MVFPVAEKYVRLCPEAFSVRLRQKSFPPESDFRTTVFPGDEDAFPAIFPEESREPSISDTSEFIAVSKAAERAASGFAVTTDAGSLATEQPESPAKRAMESRDKAGGLSTFIMLGLSGQHQKNFSRRWRDGVPVCKKTLSSLSLYSQIVRSPTLPSASTMTSLTDLIPSG